MQNTYDGIENTFKGKHVFSSPPINFFNQIKAQVCQTIFVYVAITPNSLHPHLFQVVQVRYYKVALSYIPRGGIVTLIRSSKHYCKRILLPP